MNRETGSLSKFSSTPQQWTVLCLSELSAGKNTGEINARWVQNKSKKGWEAVGPEECITPKGTQSMSWAAGYGEQSYFFSLPTLLLS